MYDTLTLGCNPSDWPSADIPEWGIVEVLGHRTLYGRLELVQLAGAPLIRVSMPAQTVLPSEPMRREQWDEDAGNYRTVWLQRQGCEVPAVVQHANPGMLYGLREVDEAELLAMRADAAQRSHGGSANPMLPATWEPCDLVECAAPASALLTVVDEPSDAPYSGGK